MIQYPKSKAYVILIIKYAIFYGDDKNAKYATRKFT